MSTLRDQVKQIAPQLQGNAARDYLRLRKAANGNMGRVIFGPGNYGWENDKLTEEDLQSAVTQLKKRLEAQQQAGIESAQAARDKKKAEQEAADRAKNGKKGERKGKEPINQKGQGKKSGPMQNSGSYSRASEVNPTMHKRAEEIMQMFMSKDIYIKPNYPKLLPFAWSNPKQMFPDREKKKEEYPMLMLRSWSTGYMSKNMKDLCNSFKDIASQRNWDYVTYGSFGGEFTTQKQEPLPVKKLLSLPSRTILAPTCGCSGGSYGMRVWKALAERHRLVVVTHYGFNNHCGCNTFHKLRQDTKAEIIHDICS